MRHQIAGKRLNRTTGARNALRRNLIKQLFEHERIKTTKAKAAAVRGDAEKLITLASKNIIQLTFTQTLSFIFNFNLILTSRGVN